MKNKHDMSAKADFLDYLSSRLDLGEICSFTAVRIAHLHATAGNRAAFEQRVRVGVCPLCESGPVVPSSNTRQHSAIAQALINVEHAAVFAGTLRDVADAIDQVIGGGSREK